MVHTMPRPPEDATPVNKIRDELVEKFPEKTQLMDNQPSGRVYIRWYGANKIQLCEFMMKNGWVVQNINARYTDYAYVRFARIAPEPEYVELDSASATEANPNYGTLNQ